MCVLQVYTRTKNFCYQRWIAITWMLYASGWIWCVLSNFRILILVSKLVDCRLPTRCNWVASALINFHASLSFLLWTYIHRIVPLTSSLRLPGWIVCLKITCKKEGYSTWQFIFCCSKKPHKTWHQTLTLKPTQTQRSDVTQAKKATSIQIECANRVTKSKN